MYPKVSVGVCVLLLVFALVFLVSASTLWIFCGVFWFVGVELVTGLVLLPAAVVGLKRRGLRGPGYVFVLFVILLCLAVLAVALNSIALTCWYQGDQVLCEAVGLRVARFGRTCGALFDRLLYQDLQLLPQTGQILRCIFYTINLSFGWSLLVTCSFVLWRLRPFVLESNRYMTHVVLGFIVLLSGCLHVALCAPYFFVGIGLATASVQICAGLYGLYASYHSRITAVVVHVIVAVLCLTLVGISVFGVVCWQVQRTNAGGLFGGGSGFHVDDQWYGAHCWRSGTGLAVDSTGGLYSRCRASLTDAFYDERWPEWLVTAEILRAQVATYGILITATMVDFVFCVFVIVNSLKQKDPCPS